MKAFVLFCIAIVAQATVFHYFKEYGISFDCILAFVIVLGFMRGDYQRLMMPAFVAGLVLDSMSGAPFGAMTTALMVTLVALSGLSVMLAREHMVHFIAFAIVGSVLFSATVFFITMVLEPATGLSVIGVLSVIGYNTAGAFLVYFLFRWIILLKNRIAGR